MVLGPRCGSHLGPQVDFLQAQRLGDEISESEDRILRVKQLFARGFVDAVGILFVWEASGPDWRRLPVDPYQQR
jgi:hypothetical protein